MSLTFLTPPQQMTFVDTSTGLIADPYNLLPEHVYDIYVTVQNDSNAVAVNVSVEFQHSAFGIGLVGGTDLFTPNPIIFDEVPPKAYGLNGQATGHVSFITPAANHGCITAQILPNGQTLNQNLTVIPTGLGAESQTDFLVFGHDSTDVILTLSEKTDVGGVIQTVPAGASWNPLIIGPTGIGPIVPTLSPVTLHGLDPANIYNCHLQVNVPAVINEKHIFNIVGTDANTGAYIGEVTITFDATIPAGLFVKCAPFIFGGYQSADVLLTDLSTGLPVPLGGTPSGPWDTLLQPNTDYGFSARVHNFSSTPAVNTIVRFWDFPGGLALSGTLVDVQTATIPASGSVIVKATKPFHSAPPAKHSCAVVSISNAQSQNCTTDATVSTDVPNPGQDGEVSCSAWRNTDSMWVISGLPWHVGLELKVPHIWGPGPVEIIVDAQFVPGDWKQSQLFIETDTMLKSLDIQSVKPEFLLSPLRKNFKNIDLEINIETGKGEVTKFDANGMRSLSLNNGKGLNFNINGKIPKTLNAGDILLVNVTARYRGSKNASRTVEYLQVLHVRNK